MFPACPWFPASLERMISELFHLYLPRYTNPMNSNMQMFWVHELIALFSCKDVTEWVRPRLAVDAVCGPLGAVQFSEYSSSYSRDINKK